MTHHFEALGWTLIHFCWQAAVIAIVYRAADSALRKSTSQVRYVLALTALLSMLAASLVTLGYEEQRVSATVAMQARMDTWPAEMAATRSQIVSAEMAAAPLSVASATTTSIWLGEGLSTGTTLGRMMPWVDMVWLAGVLCLSLRTLGGWYLVERLRRSKLGEAPKALQSMFDDVRERLELTGTVALRVSEEVAGPLTIGVFRALVIVPASAMMALAPEELEVVLAHELAHVRRADYLWNLVQTLVETLFFFHPAVWWVSRSLREQRELCCDDAALEVCGNPGAYASALYRLEEQRTRNLELAMAFDGNQSRLTLRRRIQRILGEPNDGLRRRPLAPVSMVGLIAALAVFLLPMPQMLGSLHLPHETAAKQDAAQWAASPSPAPAATAAATAEPAPKPQAQPAADPLPPEQKAAADQKRAIEAQAEIARDAKKLAEVQVELAKNARAIAEKSRLSDADRKRIEEARTELTQQLKTLDESKGEIATRMKEIAEAGKLSAADMDKLASAKAQLQIIADNKIALKTDIDALVKVQTDMAAKNLCELKTLSKVEMKRLADTTAQLTMNMKDLGNMKFDFAMNAMDMKDMAAAQAASADARKGVQASPDYIERMKAAGYSVDVNEYSGMKMMGVTPEYAEQMSKIGLGKPSAHELIALKMHGVTPEYVQQMHDAGITPKCFHDVVAFKMFGVTPQYLADMKSAGFGSIPTNELIGLKMQGVTPEMAKAAKAQFPDATPHDLITLKMFHIDAAFIESAKQRGITPLTIQKLVQLKMFGLMDAKEGK